MQLDRFRQGLDIEQELDVHGRRGAYFVAEEITLRPDEERQWGIVADVNQGPDAVANLINARVSGEPLSEEVTHDLTSVIWIGLASLFFYPVGLQIPLVCITLGGFDRACLSKSTSSFTEIKQWP